MKQIKIGLNIIEVKTSSLVNVTSIASVLTPSRMITRGSPELNEDVEDEEQQEMEFRIEAKNGDIEARRL